MSIARLAAAALLALASLAAHAAYSCSVSSPGFSEAYDPTLRSTTVTSSEFTITCTRSLSDASTMDWSIRADNGMYPRFGNRNRAAFGRSRVNYDVFQDGACGTQWGGNSTMSGTLDFSGSLSATETVTYWGCIPARQRGLPAGTYTDLVTTTLTYGPFASTASGTMGVNISSPARCQLTTPPGNLVFNYAAFGAAANASTTYGVTCTSYLAYTMSLDATSGTLLGLSYTLALGAAAGTGIGAEQDFTITGNIAAGQGGVCGTGTCTASQARTLTVSY